MFGGPFSAVRWTPEAARTSPESSRRARQVYSRSTSRLGFVRRCSASEVKVVPETHSSVPRRDVLAVTPPHRCSAVTCQARFGSASTLRWTPCRRDTCARRHDGRRSVSCSASYATRKLASYKHFSPIGAWERHLLWQVQLLAQREHARTPPSRPSPHTPHPGGRPFHRVAGGRSESTSRPRSFACQAPGVHG